MINEHYAFAGAITGLFVGMSGVGGGALMTPILLLFFGVPPTTAIATDLWFAVVTKIVAVGIHNKGGQIDWQIVHRLWWGSLPTALLVVLLVSFGATVQKVSWLSQAIGIVVLITAIGLLIAPKLLSLAREERIGHPSEFKARQPMLTVTAGVILGLSVAMTSIGAGAMGSVMLLYLYPLRLKPHRLIATDIAHAIPLAFISGLGYLFADMVDGKMLISLLAGSIPAVIAGSFFTRLCSARILQIILACALLLAGFKILM
jgi:uncharacterized membrane protein YfcA